MEWYNDIHFYFCHMNTVNQSKTIGEFYNFTFMLKYNQEKKVIEWKRMNTDSNLELSEIIKIAIFI